MNIEEEIDKLKSYIDDNYEVKTKIEERWERKYLIIKNHDNKYEFYISPPNNESYIPLNYMLMCERSGNSPFYTCMSYGRKYENIEDFKSNDFVKELPKKKIKQYTLEEMSYRL